MAETNALARIIRIFIVVCVATAVSSSSWYCHRLVPRFITSYVTPCTFPCLVLSRQEHPNIIVQNEADGTPCHIPPGVPQEGKIGKCRRSICRQEESYQVLKRNRRFICLIAVARLLKLRKQRKALQEEIWQLREQLARNGYNVGYDEGSSRAAEGRSRGVGRFAFDNTGNNIGGGSSVENIGVGGRGTSNIPFPESEIGTSGISGGGSLGLPSENTVGGGKSGNLMRGPGAIETQFYRRMNGDSRSSSVSGDLYTSTRLTGHYDLPGSSSGRTFRADNVGGPGDGTTGENLASGLGPGCETNIPTSGGFR